MRDATQWLKRSAICCSLAVSVLGCEAARAIFVQPNQERAAEDPMVQGSNKASPNRWTSDNRPAPWSPNNGEDEHEPFRPDRFEILPYQAIEREKLREEHNRQVEVLGAQPLAACEGLPAATIAGCPLVETRWTARRELPEGVMLEAKASSLPAETLQRQMQCHLARGKLANGAKRCPLQWKGITARAERRGDSLVLLLTSGDASQAGELRRIIRALVALP